MNNGFTYTIGVQIAGSGSVNALINSMSILDNHTNSAIGKVAQLSSQFNGFGSIGSSATNNVLDGVKKLAVGVGALGIGKQALTWAAGMEQTNLSFEVMLRSADKAKTILGQLTKFADITPFDNAGVIQSGKSLLAMGFESNSVLSTLTKIGNVAAGISMPLQDMSAMWGKMSAGVIVHTDDLNQLANRGVPILRILSDMYKTNTQSILEMAEKGKLQFSAIDRAFDVLVGKGGMFENMMSRQAETVAGKWSTFTSSVEKLATDIGTRLLPTALDLLNNYLIPSVDWIGRNTDILGLGATAIGSYVIGLKAYTLWQGLSTLVAGGFTGVMTLLNGVLLANPIGLVVGGLAALTGGVIYAWHHFEGFRGFLFGMWNVVKVFGTMMYDFMIAPLLSAGKVIYGIITQDYSMIANGISDGINASNRLIDNFANMGERFGNAFSSGYHDGVSNFANENNPMSLLGNKYALDNFGFGVLGGQVGNLVRKDAITSAFGDGGNSDGNGANKPAKALNGINNITSGGAKPTNINISIHKMQGVETIRVENGSGVNVDVIGEQILRKLTQVINNAQQIQS